MKQIYFVIAFLSFSHLTYSQGNSIQKVLFVGNSITYFNDMPQTFKEIAQSKGKTTSITQHTPGGTGFIHHVQNTQLFNLFRQGGWDYIILQPGSNESAGYSATIEESKTRAQILLDSIYKYSPCAKVLYYEISYGVWGNSEENLQTYNSTMAAIKNNLTYLADSTHIPFAPAGEAMKTAWNTDPHEMLWGGAGDIHPNAKGSYIIASVMFASIFRESPVGSTYHATLNSEDALKYQTLADTITLNHPQQWRFDSFNLSADFTYSSSEDSLIFTDNSTFADSVNWDFGDGNYSNARNGFHIYTSPGTYTVKLTAYQHACSMTKEQEISITISQIENKARQRWQVFPNPAQHTLFIQVQEEDNASHFEIYNSLGQVVLLSEDKKIDVSALPRGVYFIRKITKTSSNTYPLKWIKE